MYDNSRLSISISNIHGRYWIFQVPICDDVMLWILTLRIQIDSDEDGLSEWVTGFSESGLGPGRELQKDCYKDKVREIQFWVNPDN